MDPNVPPGGTQPGWAPPPGTPGSPYPGSPYPGAPYASGPAPVWGQPAPKGGKRFGWGALIGVFVLGGVISAIVTVVSMVVLAVTIGMPDAIAGTHPEPKEGAEVAEVGDCLEQEPSRAVVVDRSEVVDCDELHGSEVADVVEVPGFNHRPSEDDLKMFTDYACSLAFRGYVGSDPLDSRYGYAAVVPSTEAWAGGDRSVWCLVDTTSGEPGDGSVRNSGN